MKFCFLDFTQAFIFLTALAKKIQFCWRPFFRTLCVSGLEKEGGGSKFHFKIGLVPNIFLSYVKFRINIHRGYRN